MHDVLDAQADALAALVLVPAQLCPGFGHSHVVKINGGEVRVEGVGFGIERFRRPHEPDQKSLSALDEGAVLSPVAELQVTARRASEVR
ncbi:MAG: hypothetical protein H0W81_01925 [Chloroflexi bacterium]|nr:hypothetical protein [Chloroflexota bacterium]